MCGPDAPAVLLAGSGPADTDTRELRPQLADKNTPVVLAGTGAAAQISWTQLSGPAECLLAAVRGQQLALQIALERGVNPDHPAGLNKITSTH